MTFSDLYHQLLPLWGNPVPFADGAVLEHKNPFLALGKLKGQENTSAGKEHFYSQDFSTRWQHAEKQITAEQILEKQVLWAMYQVFHSRARQLFEQQLFSLNPAEVNAAEVEQQLLKNLSQPGYETELDLYRNLGS